MHRGESQSERLMDAQSVARRVLCLGAFIMRAQLEISAAPDEEPHAEESVVRLHAELSDRVNSWLKIEGLWAAVSRREADLLKQPFGTWRRRHLIDGSWRSEALCVLVWCLGLRDRIPAYDEHADQQAMIDSLPLLEPIDRFVGEAELVDTEVILAARETAEMWLWRARTYGLQQAPQQWQDVNFDEIVASAAKHGEQQGRFKAIDDDFPAFGKAYRSLSEAEWSMMGSVASERLYGLNWVCGYSDDWDEVPTDT